MASQSLHRTATLTSSWWEAEASRPAPGHRALMRLVATAVALAQVRGDDADLERLAERTVPLAHRFAALQGADGLFSSDGNLHSPPDSGFSLNDLAVTLELLAREETPVTRALTEVLTRVAAAAVPAMATGGIHTPNHRWEIGAALVRLRRFDERAEPRAREWLAEGVDADADAIYSERSANYAAAVSNPCLLVLAEGLDRPDLVDVVHRNLHTTLDLTDADGVVETLFSRRQDHGSAIPLSRFHAQLRRFAHAGCDVCAAAVPGSEPTDPYEAAGLLLEMAVEPGVAADVEAVPAAPRPAWRRELAGVGLLVAEDGGARSVVHGGSDVPAVGRVGSGLAANPTFLRFRSGAAVLRSLRLSRTFFGLGPFRSEGLRVDDDGTAHLHERVSARYHQPLPEAARREDGDYRLEHEGRFWSAMAFSERPGDDVELATDVIVTPLEDGGVQVRLEQHGPDVPWSLELALGEGEVTGAREVAAGVLQPTGPRVELRNGVDAVVVDHDTVIQPDVAGGYHPGEVYAFLGGTDALGGPRLYLTGTAPGATTLTLRPA